MASPTSERALKDASLLRHRWVIIARRHLLCAVGVAHQALLRHRLTERVAEDALGIEGGEDHAHAAGDHAEATDDLRQEVDQPEYQPGAEVAPHAGNHIAE